MPGARANVGKFLNRLLILALIALCGYLYWQVIGLQKKVAQISGNTSAKASSAQWLNYKINLPPNIQAFGSHNINLIQQARQHMINANAAARAGNFGESSKESQTADDDLKQVEAGASAQTRNAVTSLRNDVSDLQHRVHAAEQAFSENQSKSAQ